jgi:hypothetical protein
MLRHVLFGGLVLIVLSLLAEPLTAQGRGGGPPFCRSGQGHPVHGWAWCVEKGWAPAPRYDDYYPAPVRGWDLVIWEDARFNHRRPPRQQRWLDRSQVVDVVGEAMLRRVEGYGPRGARRAEIRGRWVSGDFGGAALEILVGSVPVAYLHDLSLDGRVDRVYLRPRR